MGIYDRDYMYSPKGKGEYGPPSRDRGYAPPAPDRRVWVFREFAWGRRPVTHALCTIFLAVNAIWVAALWGWSPPVQIAPVLQQNFALDQTDAGAHRYHCYVTHAFLWGTDEYAQMALLLAALVFFGNVAERRLGSVRTLVLFLAATAAGGWLTLWTNSADGHAAWEGFARTVQERAGPSIGPVAAGALTEVLARFQSPIDGCRGPGAVLMAFIVVGVVCRPKDGTSWDNLWVSVLAAAFVAVDCLGLLRSSGSTVGYAIRSGGLLTGLCFLPLHALSYRWGAADRGANVRRGRPWLEGLALTGRLALLALPAAALALTSGGGWATAFTPPAFAPNNFEGTCLWLDRIGGQVARASARGNLLQVHEELDGVQTQLTTLTGKTVAWNLAVAEITESEIQLAPLYVVDAKKVEPVRMTGWQNDDLGRLFQIHDTGVSLAVEGGKNVAIPMTEELRSYARRLSRDSTVTVVGTIDKVQLDPHPSAMTLSAFQISLTGVKWKAP